jgi:hypothetical protein
MRAFYTFRDSTTISLGNCPPGAKRASKGAEKNALNPNLLLFQVWLPLANGRLGWVSLGKLVAMLRDERSQELVS